MKIKVRANLKWFARTGFFALVFSYIIFYLPCLLLPNDYCTICCTIFMFSHTRFHGVSLPYVFGTIFKKALQYKELFRYMSICEETETGQGFNDTKFHIFLYLLYFRGFFTFKVRYCTISLYYITLKLAFQYII